MFLYYLIFFLITHVIKRISKRKKSPKSISDLLSPNRLLQRKPTPSDCFTEEAHAISRSPARALILMSTRMHLNPNRLHSGIPRTPSPDILM